jgi:hypothetical protein
MPRDALICVNPLSVDWFTGMARALGNLIGKLRRHRW